MKTIDEFWFWLETNFVGKLRAQQWYNHQRPIHLNGYLNDKVNRHIGWTMMKQYRVHSLSCSVPSLQSRCHHDYHQTHEEKSSFKHRRINQTTGKAFQYQQKLFHNQQTIQGEHGQYSLSYEGYLYEFRGRP